MKLNNRGTTVVEITQIIIAIAAVVILSPKLYLFILDALGLSVMLTILTAIAVMVSVFMFFYMLIPLFVLVFGRILDLIFPSHLGRVGMRNFFNLISDITKWLLKFIKIPKIINKKIIWICLIKFYKSVKIENAYMDGRSTPRINMKKVEKECNRLIKKIKKPYNWFEGYCPDSWISGGFLCLDCWFLDSKYLREYCAQQGEFAFIMDLEDYEDNALTSNPFKDYYHYWEENLLEQFEGLRLYDHFYDKFIDLYLRPSDKWKYWQKKMHPQKGPFRKWKTGEEPPYLGGWRQGKKIDEILALMGLKNNLKNKEEYKKIFAKLDVYYDYYGI